MSVTFSDSPLGQTLGVKKWSSGVVTVVVFDRSILRQFGITLSDADRLKLIEYLTDEA